MTTTSKAQAHLTTTSTSCPSCGGLDTRVDDGIASETLINGYRRGLAIDVSAQIPATVSHLDLLRCTDCDLRWFRPMAAGDASFYEVLQVNDWYYQDSKPEFNVAASRIEPLAKVLEVGCGKGAFAGHLRPNAEYRGLEFNKKAVLSAQSAGLDVVSRSIQDEALINPRTFDVVCHFQVLEHVPEISSFMAACITALKPGGQLMCTVPAEDSFLSLVADGWLNMPPHHVSLWTDRALLALANLHGLVQTELVHETVSSFHTDWYEATLREHAVREFLGIKRQLGRTGLAGALARRSSRFPWLARAWLRRSEKGFQYAGRGHSVTLFATKP